MDKNLQGPETVPKQEKTWAYFLATKGFGGAEFEILLFLVVSRSKIHHTVIPIFQICNTIPSRFCFSAGDEERKYFYSSV
uniref:Uncharacterized protein n=1 Tax=Trichobilharzia regenti TaxID=157069 RepID=A0AA85KFE0_TRIRE|nr:unnamed protein product [Trichobilharzia regenti]